MITETPQRIPSRLLYSFIRTCTLFLGILSIELAAQRSSAGLQALYDFSEGSGELVHDQSGVGKPVHLKINNADAVRWASGSLTLIRPTQIRSNKAADKLNRAVRQTSELTVEAWITPQNQSQKGPARIVTLSRNGSERNFTLGQDGDKYDFRLRTLKTGGNGIPSLTTKKTSVDLSLTHVVYTRNRAGQARLFINGEQRAEKRVSGSTYNWHGNFRLALGNEFGGKRAWLGQYHLVAIYSRDLLPAEVQAHFAAGPDAETPPVQAVQKPDPNEDLFITRIAPLFAERCLECHDSSNHKGDLDLSHKTTALAGSSSGAVIVPGKPEESYLLESILSDEMPEKRDPLSEEEKAWVKEWIAGGASWPVETIDPANFVHGGVSQQHWIQRLTVPEYIATVKSVVGVDIHSEAEALLPRDLRADGFSNTAYNLGVDLKHVNGYARLAESIVSKMDTTAFARQFSKSSLLTDNNMRGLIEKMGKWILRGHLEAHEIDLYRGISTTVASAGGEFSEAVSLIVEAMLQSPRFIYRVENQQGDGTRWHVGEHELASRVSYIIWGTAPDKSLMEAAEAGKLYTQEGMTEQIDRMLADRRAVDRSRQFVSEWLNLNRLRNMKPNPGKYPKWEPELGTDMILETLEFFETLVWEEQRPLSDLFNAQFTHLTPRLAAHYGLPSNTPAGRYDLTSIAGRGGLLTQGSTLTVGGDEASMVSRGLFVLHDLLRGIVNDPPPCVDTTPQPTKAGSTQRTMAEERIANAQCGGCHSRFEPLAFALEKFDGIGRHHEHDEHGNRLREDGKILIPGQRDALDYSNSAEFMDLLANSDRVRETLTWKLTQFALGRPLAFPDAASVDKIHQQAQNNGGTYQSLIAEIVNSDLVRTIPTERTE